MDENQKEKIEEDVSVQNENVASQENSRIESDIKKETVNTFNEAKEKMKNIDFKAEAETGKGLIKKLLKNPFEAIKEISHDPENNFFKTALLLIAIWAIISLIKQIIYYFDMKHSIFLMSDILRLIKVTISPVLKILALTLAIFVINKKSKKSFITIITTVTVAKIPLIASSILGLLTYLGYKMSYITNPISLLLGVISTVLVYFAVKALSDEEDEAESFKLFMKIEAIYYIMYFALNFLDISL